MRPIGIVVALCLAGPVSVMAAGADPQSPKPAETRPAVVVEEVKHDFVLGPEVKFTQLNDRDATLVGGYGGVLVDKSLLVGAAGYGLTNGDQRFRMAYGGGLVEWFLFSGRAIDLSLRGLAGAGRARVAHRWNGLEAADRIVAFGHKGAKVHTGGNTVAGAAPAYLVYETDFVIGEPQLNIVWHAARRISISAGVSYRAIGSASGLEKDLRGAAGAVSVRFGGSR
jgi:hypothetical protein